jgi:SAM-dependent methyltransferase
MVPAVFCPWAKDLLDTAALTACIRVLDVACGTGIVARLAAPRVRSNWLGPKGPQNTSALTPIVFRL